MVTQRRVIQGFQTVDLHIDAQSEKMGKEKEVLLNFYSSETKLL